MSGVIERDKREWNSDVGTLFLQKVGKKKGERFCCVIAWVMNSSTAIH